MRAAARAATLNVFRVNDSAVRLLLVVRARCWPAALLALTLARIHAHTPPGALVCAARA